MKLSVQDIKTGAVYKYGWTRRLDRDQVEQLLADRTPFKGKTAKCIVAHWFTTEPYRRATEA